MAERAWDGTRTLVPRARRSVPARSGVALIDRCPNVRTREHDRPHCPGRARLPHRPRRSRQRPVAGEPLARRARRPGRDGRGVGGGQRLPASPRARPGVVLRQGPRRRAGRREGGHRLQRAHRRRRAGPQPAAQPREAAGLQGAGSIGADHRHLRSPREDEGGAPAGRAGRARVPPAAPDAAVDPPLAHRRRHRHPRPRREPARDRPAPHPREDQEGPRRPRRGEAPASHGGPQPGPPRGRHGRARWLHQRRQEHAPQRPGRCGRLRRRHALRHARPDQPPGDAVLGPYRRHDRYGRLHQQAAARPRRRLPRHARGGDARRSAARGRRCRRSELRGPAGGGAVGARRAGGRHQAADHGLQQDRPAPGRCGRPARQRVERVRQRPHRRGSRRAARADR